MNKLSIRNVYLYSFALIGLVLVVIAGVRMIGLGLKMYVFTQADTFYEYPYARPIAPTDGVKTKEPSKEEIEGYQKKQRDANRQREAAESLAMFIVGIPLYLYHWKVIQRDKNAE